MNVNNNTITTVGQNTAGNALRGILVSSSAGPTTNVNGNIVTNVQHDGCVQRARDRRDLQRDDDGIALEEPASPPVRNRNSGGYGAVGIYITGGSGWNINDNSVAEVLNVGTGSFTGHLQLRRHQAGGRIEPQGLPQLGEPLRRQHLHRNQLHRLPGDQRLIADRDRHPEQQPLQQGDRRQCLRGDRLPLHAVRQRGHDPDPEQQRLLQHRRRAAGDRLRGLPAAGAPRTSTPRRTSTRARRRPATNYRAVSTILGLATNDNASFASTVAAPFVNNTDLHIPAATATQLESGRRSGPGDRDGL